MYNEECREKGTFKAPLAQQISFEENKSFATKCCAASNCNKQVNGKTVCSSRAL